LTLSIARAEASLRISQETRFVLLIQPEGYGILLSLTWILMLSQSLSSSGTSPHPPSLVVAPPPRTFQPRFPSMMDLYHGIQEATGNSRQAFTLAQANDHQLGVLEDDYRGMRADLAYLAGCARRSMMMRTRRAGMMVILMVYHDV
jgi:hypothetical protein